LHISDGSSFINPNDIVSRHNKLGIIPELEGRIYGHDMWWEIRTQAVEFPGDRSRK
jgi:hypothetical protein